MSLTKLVATTLTAFTALAISASPVLADSPGQLGGGNEVYQVKNLTQKGSYANTIAATCNDEVQYSILLHNTSFGGFSNVNVAVNLPGAAGTTNSSTVTATTNLGGTTGTNGTAVVNTDKSATVNYEAGTATLYDVNGTVIKTLSDSIVSGGVSIGALDGSTTEFVNFKAKVNCPTPTPTPIPTPTTPAKPAPKALPNTGAGDVLGIFAGASAAGSAVHMAVTARRNRR